MKITEVSEPGEAEYEILKSGLKSFNEIYAGPTSIEQISSFAKTGEGETVGGILGELHWGWLYVKWLWVSDSYRSRGVGTKLLQKLEGYATLKGVSNFRLETTSFQALAFYKKMGYEEFGQLQDMPPNYTSHFLKKNINA